MKIYILFSCDRWKSQESFCMIAATTDIIKLKDIILKEVKKGTFEPVNKLSNIDWFYANGINDLLDYCYIAECEDGEVY